MSKAEEFVSDEIIKAEWKKLDKDERTIYQTLARGLRIHLGDKRIRTLTVYRMARVFAARPAIKSLLRTAITAEKISYANFTSRR